MEPKIIVLSFFALFFLKTLASETQNIPKKKSWRDKDIQDMTEADLEHLLDQWEVRLLSQFSHQVFMRFTLP